MKAILVIDEKPSKCNECPLLDMKGVIEDTDDYGYCMAKVKEMKPKWDGAFPIFKKPRWCPLKPLPKKKEVEVNEIEDLISAEFTVEDFYNDKYVAKIRLATDKMIALGWNACLKEIEDGEC